VGKTMDVKSAIKVARDFEEKCKSNLEIDMVDGIFAAEARQVLADAYLTMHREDDGELVRKGTTRIDGFECDVEADEPLQANWSVAVWSGDGMLGSAEMHKQPTMGQLRHLVRGLGGEA